MKAEQTVLFPPFRLDKLNQQLWYGSHPIELRRKTFLVLQHLLEHPARLVTKEELLNAVWPGVYVSDIVLKVCIRELRRILGERPAAPRFIETIHGRGYRFIGQKQGERFQEATAVAASSQQPVVSRKTTESRNQGSEASMPSFLSQHSALSTSVLVGRKAELAQLHGWLEKALSGERQFVFISGEPGIGKTALVDAFVTQATADGTIWAAHGQCIAHHSAVEPYLPVFDALSRLCRERGHEWLVTHLNQYAPLWLGQMPSLLSPADRKSLQREISRASQERMLREITEALEALTSATPLIFVLEDLHWSDSATLELLSFLARRRGPARLLVIGAYRALEATAQDHHSEEVRRELQLHGHCRQMPLSPLAEEAITQYLKTHFSPHVFPASFTQWLHQRSDGNPLFLVNVIDHLAARGILARQNDRWALTVAVESLQVDIPTDLQALIELQSEQISTAEALMLQAASVAGMEFSTAAVAAALHSDVAEVEACCEGLARRNLFLRDRGLSEWPDGTVTTCYGFIHAFYQQAWYKRVTPARRVQWQREVGKRLAKAYSEQTYEIAAALAMHCEPGRDDQRVMQDLGELHESPLHGVLLG